MKTINLIFPCSPIKFYFWSWNGGILRWHPRSAAQLSVSGDTAKYLDFNSAEVVHVHHCTHSTQITLYTTFVIRKWKNETRSFRSIFPPHVGLTRSTYKSSTTTCQAGKSPRSLIDQARAHIGNGCTRSNLHSEFFIFLCSWVAIHKWISHR